MSDDALHGGSNAESERGTDATGCAGARRRPTTPPLRNAVQRDTGSCGLVARGGQGWSSEAVFDREVACFRREVEGSIVACAVGTLELNVPNPQCPRGRAVRLANVITLPVHRRRGFGTALVDFVLDWARSIQADRVGLSATPEGSAYTRVRASC
jgi:GNAT superfamily N-acetyltransferase